MNEAFVITKEQRSELIIADQQSAEIIKPWLRGRDICRWTTPPSDRYIIFTRRGIDINRYSAIKSFLSNYRDRLTPKPRDYDYDGPGRKPGDYSWFEIQDNTVYFEKFDGPKIIWAKTSKSLSFVVPFPALLMETT